MKNIEIAKVIREIKNSDLVFNCGIPMGYVDGLPILTVKNSTLCVIIPFLKYKVTGEVDKTLVYPVRYVITVSLPDKKVVGFEDLAYNETYRKIDFGKAIGFFRHDAVKNYTKGEYKQKRAELYSMYDKIIAAIVYNEPYSEEDDEEFAELLNIMIEPSVKPIYETLDDSFYNKYLA